MYETYCDHHVHSSFSWDCETSLEELIKSARQIGLHGFVITDHLEFDPNDPGFSDFDYEDSRSLWEEVSVANPDVLIRFGAEVSHLESWKESIKKFLHGRRFHWVIGSVHHVGKEEVSRFMERVESSGQPLEEVLEPYFEACTATVTSNLYDCFGHLDFPKRYSRKGEALTGAFWLEHYRKQIRQTLAACLDLGVFLEVNTGTYRKGFIEPYPGWAILEEYRRQGGCEVVLSSDAHRPEDLATAFGAVLKELPKIGLRARNGVV